VQLIEVAAAAAGIALGAAVALIWQRASARLRGDAFWREFAAFAKSLLSDEGGEQFLRRYLGLLRSLAIYLGVKSLTLALAFLPVIGVLTCLAPVASREWNRRARQVEVFPPQPATVEVSGATFRLDAGRPRFTPPAGLDVGATLTTGSGTFACDTLLKNHALAPSRAGRLLLASFGFAMLRPTDGHEDLPSILIVRPYRGDDNVLWPYLSDPEFTFFAALSLASVAGLFLTRAKRR
jgi:hypothetical protein